MKKFFLATALLLLMTSTAFAAANIGTDQVGTFTVGGSNDSVGNPTKQLICGLSSNVHAVYYTDGTSAAPAQWYSIGTYHLGGKNVYATAQDITSIYKLTAQKIPGNLFTWAGMPEDSTQSAVWSQDMWSQL